MKRILAILLTLLLCTIPVSADEKEYTASADFLNKIGVISEVSELSQKVNRGEYAKFLYTILDSKKVTQAVSCDFSDISEESELYMAISYVNKAGLMSGYSDGAFKPDNPVSYDEAIAITVRLLGYDYMASVKGGFSVGYKRVAADLRLATDLVPKNPASLSYGEIYQLLYDSLFIPLSDINGVKNDNLLYAQSGDTLLTRYFSIYIAEGVVTDNGITNFTGESNVRTDAFKISDVVILNNGFDTTEFLGRYVKAYYRYTDELRYLVYYEYMENKYNEIQIKADDLIKPSTVTNISYKENQKKKTIKVRGDADYIYNGEATLSLPASKLNITQGKIRLIDYNLDKVYDIIFVERYTQMIVQSVNTNSKTIYGMYNEVENLKAFSDIIVTKNGEIVEFSAIAPYDVISIEKSTKNVRIDICTKVEYGKLSMIADDEWYIGENKYYLAEEFQKATSLTSKQVMLPQVGQEGTYYIGKDDKIIYFEYESGRFLGIAVYFTDGKQVFSENPQIRIFSQDGNWYNFAFANKVTVNGQPKKKEDISKIASFFDQNNEFIRQLVVYETNEDDEIIYFETADSTKPDSDTLQIEHVSNSAWRYGNVSFMLLRPDNTANASLRGSRLIYLTDTVIFKIPDVKTEERFYSVAKGKLEYDHNSAVKGTVYFNSHTKKKAANASAFVYETDSSISGTYGARSVIVADKKIGIDEDGDAVEILVIYNKGTLKEVYPMDGMNINGIDIGDMLQMSFVNDVYIRNYRKIYSSRLNIGCTDWYEKNKQLYAVDSDDFYTELCKFYGIDYNNIDTIDNSKYYITKNMLTGSPLYHPFSSSRANSGLALNTGSGVNLLSGTITWKDGNYFEIYDENAHSALTKYFTYQLGPTLGDYYGTYVYKLNRTLGKVEAGTVNDVYLGSYVCFYSEGASPIDLVVIEE